MTSENCQGSDWQKKNIMLKLVDRLLPGNSPRRAVGGNLYF